MLGGLIRLALTDGETKKAKWEKLPAQRGTAGLRQSQDENHSS